MLRRGPYMAEGYYTLEAAEEEAEEKRAQQSSTPSTGSTTGASTAVEQPGSGGGGLSEEEKRFMAEHGASFTELQEYQPAIEKQKRLLRAAPGPATARAHVEETRTAVHTALEHRALREEAEKEAQKLREKIDKIYNEEKTKIEKAYKEALERLQKEYQRLKAKGIATVRTDKGVMSLDEWYKLSRRELEEWRNKARRRLEEWRSKQLEKIREEKKQYMKELDKWLAEVGEQLSKHTAAVSRLEKTIRELAEKEARLMKRREERYNEWLSRVIDEAKKITREDEAEEYAERVYNEAYNYWLEAGLAPSEAEKRAEEAKRKALEAAMKTVRAVDSFLQELGSLYKRYAEGLTGLRYAAARHGLQYRFFRASSVEDEFREKAWELARRLGVPDEVARKLIDAYARGLREAGEKAEKWGTAVHELDELYKRYAEALAGLAKETATSAAMDIAERRRLIDQYLSEFMEKARELARRNGLGPEFQQVIQEYYKELSSLARRAGQVLEKQASIGQALLDAQRLYQEWLRRAEKNPRHYYMNIDVYKEMLRQRLLEKLSKTMPRSEAEKWASYYAQLWASNVAQKLIEAYQRLPGGVWFCYRVPGGLVCNVYTRAGRYVTTVTITGARGRTDEARKIAALATAVGYKPSELYIARSQREARNAYLAWLREKNPEQYIKELGEEAGKAKGLGKIEKYAELVTEFYRIPSEQLYKRGIREGGARGAAEAALGLIGSLGAGAIAGALSGVQAAVNPVGAALGAYAFGREVATGRILSELRSPERAAFLAGEMIGFPLGLKGVSGTAARLAEKGTRPLSLAGRGLGLLTRASEAAMAAGLVAGLAAGAKARLGLPAIVAAPLLSAKEKLRLREKGAEIEEVPGKGTLVRVKLTPETLELIESYVMEGKAEPYIRIGGREYGLLRVYTRSGTELRLVPRELFDQLATGQYEELSRALGGKILAVKMKGRLPIVYMEETPREAVAMAEEAMKQRGVPRQELEKLIEEARKQLLQRLREEERLEKLEKSIEKTRPRYEVEYETPWGRVSLGEALEALKKAVEEEEGRTAVRRMTPEELQQWIRELGFRDEQELLEWLRGEKRRRPRLTLAQLIEERLKARRKITLQRLKAPEKRQAYELVAPAYPKPPEATAVAVEARPPTAPATETTTPQKPREETGIAITQPEETTPKPSTIQPPGEKPPETTQSSKTVEETTPLTQPTTPPPPPPPRGTPPSSGTPGGTPPSKGRPGGGGGVIVPAPLLPLMAGGVPGKKSVEKLLREIMSERYQFA